MNKLYLLGALALSNVEAYVASSISSGIYSFPDESTYTYTASGDCLASATAVTLDPLTKRFYQYYTFTLAKGTVTFTTSPRTVATYAYGGCTHSHLYTWAAMPAITANAQGGLGDSLVAYGYAMTGASAATCASQSVLTTSLYTATTKVFTGSRYQSVGATLNTAATTTVSLNLAATIVNSGATGLYTTAATLTTYTAAVPPSPGPASPEIQGLLTTGTQNYWWDFAQNNFIFGFTYSGSGGGTASTTPCGWWVYYAYEMPTPAMGKSDPASTLNVQLSPQSVAVHMWTDNAMTNTLGAFVLAGLASLLY